MVVIVTSEIYKSYINNGKRPPLYFYRDSNKKEIDIIISMDGIVHPIEIKKNAAPKNAVKNFSVLKPINKFKTVVNGVITGFDRIVFKGLLRPIIFSSGMQHFLQVQNILNKDFKTYAIAQSKAIVESAEEISRQLCGEKIVYIPSSNVRKEEMAHERQKKRGIREGLIGVWSPANNYPVESVVILRYFVIMA